MVSRNNFISIIYLYILKVKFKIINVSFVTVENFFFSRIKESDLLKFFDILISVQ